MYQWRRSLSDLGLGPRCTYANCVAITCVFQWRCRTNLVKVSAGGHLRTLTYVCSAYDWWVEIFNVLVIYGRPRSVDGPGL